MSIFDARQGYELGRVPKFDTLFGNGAVRRLALASVGDDYLVCNPVQAGTNTILGDVSLEVYVLKADMLRQTRFNPDPSGTSYSYTSTTTRTATNGSTVEMQQVTPTWNVGEYIFAFNAGETFTLSNGQKTSWVDLNNSAHAWAFFQTGTM